VLLALIAGALLAPVSADATGAVPAAGSGPDAPSRPDVDEIMVHDHAPRHGGVVGMAGTRHVEILLTRGIVRVYLSDLHRVPLPLAGITGTATLRDGRSAEAPRTVQLTRKGDALEAPAAGLDGSTVDVRLDLATPSGSLLIDFTLPAAPAKE